MRELVRPAARAIARRAPDWLVADVLRRERFAFSTFGSFRRSDGRELVLFDKYRDRIKSRWRLGWWPTSTLLALDADDGISIPVELADAAARIRDARTLPVRPEEVAHGLRAIFDVHPEYFAPPTRVDPRYGMHVLEPAVEAAPAVEGYRRRAADLEQLVGRHGIELARSRVLDVGCGAGYQSFALAAVAGGVVGIDLDIETYDVPARRERAREALLGDGGEARVTIEQGDVMDLQYDDASFDVVVSNVVLEHVRDLPGAFAEIRRVLRPGGVSVNGVQPWFGPEGGHGLCTLDSPWGHVRLGEEDFGEFVATWRPLEAADAIHRYRTGFQRPRLTLDQSRAAACDAGLSVAQWSETPVGLRDVHSGLVTSELLADCRRVHAFVTKRDLLTIGYRAVLRRR